MINQTDTSFYSFKRFLKYAKPWKWKIIKSSIYSTINKLFDIAPEILIGIYVDLVVQREQSFIAQLGFDSITEFFPSMISPSRTTSFSFVPYFPCDPGSFPPCPGSMTIYFSENPVLSWPVSAPTISCLKRANERINTVINSFKWVKNCIVTRSC